MEIFNCDTENNLEKKHLIRYESIKKKNKEGKQIKPEFILQELIFSIPTLFPVIECSGGGSSKWIPLAQEISMEEGRLDILATDSNANIYILECKLESNHETKTIRSQIDNYAAGFWKEKKIHGIDTFWDRLCEKIENRSKKLEDILEDFEEDAEEIMKSMKKNFEEDRVTFIFAVDRITPNLRTSIDWWNTKVDLPQHYYPSFAFEVSRYSENKHEKNPSTIVTQLFPYDRDQIAMKNEKRPAGNDLEKWMEQLKNRRELNEEQKNQILEFKDGLQKLFNKDDNAFFDFGSGATIRLMPKFSKYIERSPIGIKSNGTLIFQFGLIRFTTGPPAYAIAEDEFRKKILEIESMKSLGKVKNLKKHSLPQEPKLRPEVWLPYKDKILSILEEVFINE